MAKITKATVANISEVGLGLKIIKRIDKMLPIIGKRVIFFMSEYYKLKIKQG